MLKQLEIQSKITPLRQYERPRTTSRGRSGHLTTPQVRGVAVLVALCVFGSACASSDSENRSDQDPTEQTEQAGEEAENTEGSASAVDQSETSNPNQESQSSDDEPDTATEPATIMIDTECRNSGVVELDGVTWQATELLPLEWQSTSEMAGSVILGDESSAIFIADDGTELRITTGGVEDECIFWETEDTDS